MFTCYPMIASFIKTLSRNLHAPLSLRLWSVFHDIKARGKSLIATLLGKVRRVCRKDDHKSALVRSIWSHCLYSISICSICSRLGCVLNMSVHAAGRRSLADCRFSLNVQRILLSSMTGCGVWNLGQTSLDTELQMHSTMRSAVERR
jgi:hypothetical protein